MTGIDLNGLMLLALAVCAVILPLWLGFRLRKSRPGVLWIGLVLTVLFGPLGQVYVAGWIGWFLIVLGICVAAQQLLDPSSAMIVMMIASPLVMYFRMRR
ncbi:hypothetical protein [Maridesulfovibrio sp.]|uniref:hypothetical protein n=1 Tax=Maridesulfovibrio sp. TaxID=2795000 RepID=UPI002A18CCD0|nr:hypothetical protein [Maridesulfovibrio sp.]